MPHSLYKLKIPDKDVELLASYFWTGDPTKPSVSILFIWQEEGLRKEKSPDGRIKKWETPAEKIEHDKLRSWFRPWKMWDYFSRDFLEIHSGEEGNNIWNTINKISYPKTTDKLFLWEFYFLPTSSSSNFWIYKKGWEAIGKEHWEKRYNFYLDNNLIPLLEKRCTAFRSLLDEVNNKIVIFYGYCPKKEELLAQKLSLEFKVIDDVKCATYNHNLLIICWFLDQEWGRISQNEINKIKERIKKFHETENWNF